ncbi:putative LRR receptor-like serine/threonine-protein kinase [Hibiscus syriacus]|uniref:non-specific serine/threonine protein kinase n=1 Tax=Hibiscus syriacus TaxID=106335 RepID=A0A6A3CEX4_HIBSY|nr:probable LRR receptor-like serine/threonine-protein kinase At1g74360 [Hibiscus syriacus]KAE8727790.1 putative LRR receptor-like serine/threonine-protein kinase [Hibiscus syriacus]
MKKKAVPWRFTLFTFLITCIMVAGDSLETDKEVLLKLKSFLQEQNRVNQGRYSEWNRENSSPCQWHGISCSSSSSNGLRVIGVNLSDSNISGKMFDNFSALTEIRQLDLSKNTIDGAIPDELSQCRSLAYLNLSHNLIEGQLNLSGLNSLEILDLSTNRFHGDIHVNFPGSCRRLIVANVSSNNFTGLIDFFDECWNLQYLDLSSNNFVGNIWTGFPRLIEFSVSENSVSGPIPGSIFPNNCSLRMLDLSVNKFQGEFPGEISYCKNLTVLNVYGNEFTGKIPSEIGMISSLEGLFLGNNSFSSVIPETLLNLTNLEYLDLSKSNFGGEIQEIFGRFTQLKFLVLHGNSYKGGLHSSGILRLQNLSALDLSYNNFTVPLPVEISQMKGLTILMMAHNQFTGNIPLEYGNLLQLQALDLSFNNLSGLIPREFGKLSSLLWLMLANNSLNGEIPPQIGNCSSLLWLNLANNQLSGTIPPQLVRIGTNATSTFELNRVRSRDRSRSGTGECASIKRWIPADYPPFNFMYTILTRKNCRSIWDKLLKGVGIFPMCSAGSMVRTYQISGYVQLSGNRFSGPIPADIGLMQNFSMLHLGFNGFEGELPAEIGRLQLSVLNITRNMFSGTIPAEIGNVKCLQMLDLSYNNFSGMFPASLNKLSELTKFNISYNPFISGAVPTIGQFATFEKESYLGDPLLHVPDFIANRTDHLVKNHRRHRKSVKLAVFLVLLGLTLAFLVFGILSLLVLLVRIPEEPAGSLLWNTNFRHNLTSSSGGSSPLFSDTVKVIRLDKTAFTHADILRATDNFSEDRVLGKGGYGTVYRGVLPDGREVAVKKLQREGIEGEREFRAEMEVLRQNGFGWPHPNLVPLYGWCLDGLKKILVYEYMEGGSLEDVITDQVRLTWRRRIDMAVDIARALVFLHHECYPAIVHRDVKASNVLLDKYGRARVTDFGLARVVDVGDSHVSTTVAGTIGYVAPEYGHTWQATTKGDVYSYGVLVMELATGRRAVDGAEECLVEWARRIMGNGENGLVQAIIPVALDGSGPTEGAVEMCELLQIAVRCIAETPQARPNMKEVLDMLIRITNSETDFTVRMSNSYQITEVYHT